MDKDFNYWKTVADRERKRADGNLRLAAERAIENADLRLQLQAAWAEIKRLRTEAMENEQPVV